MKHLQALVISIVSSISLIIPANAGSYGHRIPMVRDVLSATEMSPETRYGYKMVFAYCIQIFDDTKSMSCTRNAIKTTNNALDAQRKARAIVNGGAQADKQYLYHTSAQFAT